MTIDEPKTTAEEAEKLLISSSPCQGTYYMLENITTYMRLS